MLAWAAWDHLEVRGQNLALESLAVVKMLLKLSCIELVDLRTKCVLGYWWLSLALLETSAKLGAELRLTQLGVEALRACQGCLACRRLVRGTLLIQHQATSLLLTTVDGAVAGLLWLTGVRGYSLGLCLSTLFRLFLLSLGLLPQTWGSQLQGDVVVLQQPLLLLKFVHDLNHRQALLLGLAPLHLAGLQLVQHLSVAALEVLVLQV